MCVCVCVSVYVCVCRYLYVCVYLYDVYIYTQIYMYIHIYVAPLVTQMVKCLSTMWETWVRSLGKEDPPEKEMPIHSSTIAWKIPWTEEPGRLQSMGSQRVGHD